MQRTSVLDKGTALRAKELGTLGESIAPLYLERAGFTSIRNLNDIKTNYPYADVVATRNGITYAISIKTRNKYEARTGKLNARYKLGKKCTQMAAFACGQRGSLCERCGSGRRKILKAAPQTQLSPGTKR